MLWQFISFGILALARLEKGKLETSMWYGVPHVHKILIFSLEREVKTARRHSWCHWSVFETFPVNLLQLSSWAILCP
jgi:hypothetical protein